METDNTAEEKLLAVFYTMKKKKKSLIFGEKNVNTGFLVSKMCDL